MGRQVGRRRDPLLPAAVPLSLRRYRCLCRAPTAARPLPRGGFIARAPPAGRRCPPPPPPPPPRREHGAGRHPFRGSARPSPRPRAPPFVGRRCLRRVHPGCPVCTRSLNISGEPRRTTRKPGSPLPPGA